MTDNKTKPTAASVESFIAGIDNKRRHEDALTALALYQQVTQLPAVMWGESIIGFGTHHYPLANGKQGAIAAAGFSPRKANMTFYLGGSFDGASELYSKLGKHRKSTACVYINKLSDVDLTVLAEIVMRDFKQTLSKQ